MAMTCETEASKEPFGIEIIVGHADHNAAIVIAARGVVRWGEVMRPHAAPTLTAS